MLTIIPLFVVVNVWADGRPEMVVKTGNRIKFTVMTNNRRIVEPNLPQQKMNKSKRNAVKQTDINPDPKNKIGTLGKPKFTNPFFGEVSYDHEYSKVIKVENSDFSGTKIIPVKVPEWLKIRTQPFVTTVNINDAMGGNNGIAQEVRFFAPYALTSDSKGTLYVTDQIDNRIRKINASGEVTTVAGSFSAGFKDGASDDARFHRPAGIAVDQQGNIYISDQQNHAIRKISPTGSVITIAGSQKAGDVDGNAADAMFNQPAGICLDSKGFIYVADRGNNKIRVISPEGIVSTLAGSGQAGYAEGNGISAKFNMPTGIAIDSSGHLYITDQVNNRIRKIALSSRVVSTLAGNGEFAFRNGDGPSASFKYPTGIFADHAGNLFVTDQLNNSVRMINRSGSVSNLIATSENDVESVSSRLNTKNPMGICLNPDGDVFIADYYNFSIKKISMNSLLYGTPPKSAVGDHEIIINATNEYGTSVLSGKLTVRDNIGPIIVSTLPANGSTGVARATNISVTFDEMVSFGKSGSINVFSDNQIISKLDITKAVADRQLALSADQKSVMIALNDLPAGSAIQISIDDESIIDKANNPFRKGSSPLATWSFLTSQKLKQVLELSLLEDKIYGDAAFDLGAVFSSAALPILYTAEDPAILSIIGNSARILKVGNTNIIAVQPGDSNYLEEKVIRTISISPRPVVIKPVKGQFMVYGMVAPTIKYELISGSILDQDKPSGQLEKTKGDTVGIYGIRKGNLTYGDNYTLKLADENITVQKAPLLLKVQNQTKIAGTENTAFSCIYEGFVKGEGVTHLLTMPEFSCSATDSSFVGTYPIKLTGASSKNYAISYQSGVLSVLSTGNYQFNLEYVSLFENMVAGTIAAKLTQLRPGNKIAVFSLIPGTGDEDNASFRISGNSIFSTGSFDYESKNLFSVRVRSEGAFGESFEKAISISIIDVNERPEMSKIPIEVVCSNGVLQLTGINAGPERDQDVQILVSAEKPGSYFETSPVVGGVSTLTYSIPNSYGNVINLRIVVKDNGGTAGSGTDSVVYKYSLKVIRQTNPRILSEKGIVLQRGAASYLSITGPGKIQWYFKNQILKNGNSNSMEIRAEESGTYSVQVTSEGGCVLS